MTTIRSKPPSKEYKEGYERIFGESDPKLEGQSYCRFCHGSPIERCICKGPLKKETE